MAKDETLLLYYKKNHTPVFRIYSWDTPAVSLGYRQKAEDVLDVDICRKSGIPLVRRITGGGAILHYKEITYSLICGINDLGLPRNVKDSYKALNSFLISFYSKLGLKASFACDIHGDIKSKPAELCFIGFEPFDIIIRGKKAGGNAQRRSKNIIFQHGSIPFDIDYTMLYRLFRNSGNLAAKVFYLKKTLHEEDYNTLQKVLKDSFAETFRVHFKDVPVSSEESNILEYLLSFKYSKETWNFNSEKNKLAQ